MTRSELIDQPFSRFIVEADQEICANYWCRISQNGELPICDLRMAKPDGTLFWVHLTAAFVQDTNGHSVIHQMAEMLGYAVDALMGKVYDSLMAEDQLDDHNV